MEDTLNLCNTNKIHEKEIRQNRHVISSLPMLCKYDKGMHTILDELSFKLN